MNNNRFEIDPLKFRKDKAYIGCLFIWSIGILVIISVGVWAKIWFVAVFGAIMLLATIPYALSQRNKIDTLVATPECLMILRNNNPNTAVRINRGSALELSLENVENFDDIESTSTLNLWDTAHGNLRRHCLGLWISEEDKICVFHQLHDFLTQHGFNIQAYNKIGQRKPNQRVDLTR